MPVTVSERPSSDSIDMTDRVSRLSESEESTHWMVTGFIGETSRLRQWRRENFDDENDEADIPDLYAVTSISPIYTLLSSEVKENCIRLGQRIALFSDHFRAVIEPEVSDWVDGCEITSDLTPQEAYVRFREIAKNVFEDGVTIQKVQLFLHFGYGVLINVVQHHMPQMIGHVINSLARFMNEEKIAGGQGTGEPQTITQWVEREGGWAAAATTVAVARKAGVPWDVVAVVCTCAGYLWFRYK